MTPPTPGEAEPRGEEGGAWGQRRRARWPDRVEGGEEEGVGEEVPGKARWTLETGKKRYCWYLYSLAVIAVLFHIWV